MTNDARDGAMTKGDRDDLAGLVRKRARLAKAKAKERAAAQRAAFAALLAAEYDPIDAGVAGLVNDATAQLSALNARVNATIAATLLARGIPKKFHPSYHAYPGWDHRGENATATRRVELLRVAETAIQAQEREAITAIETRALDMEERLIAGSLRSTQAQSFLAQMPNVEELMPALSVADVEAKAGGLRLLPQSAEDEA